MATAISARTRAGNVIGGGDVCADRLIPDLINSYSSGSIPKLRAPNSVRPWQHVLDCLNASELAQRRFREIARIAGLVFQGFPGAGKSAKQLQASSGLFFEVFRKYDQGNLLLEQAQREALEQELDLARMMQALNSIQSKTLVYQSIDKPSPFAFPLLIERLRETVSTEKLSDRVARMVAELEKAAQV